MSTGTASFYRMKGSLSSGEYPLLNVGQDLSSYLVHTATVRYAKGLQTRITVPDFTGSDTVNIIGIDGRFYWATEYMEATTASGSVTYTLDFMGPTSLFRNGQTVTGNWHKLPSRTPYMRQQIMNDVIKIKDRELFDDLDCPDDDIFWVQVSGYDANNEVLIYGFFVSYKFSQQALGFNNAGLQCDTNDTSKRYPSMIDVFKSVSDTLPGLDAKKLIDVSISRRCPYATRKEELSLLDVIYQIDYYLTSMRVPDIVNANGTYVYQMNKANGLAPFFNPSFVSQTVTLLLSDYEIDCGFVSIVDWNRNAIMQIVPTDADALTITARMYADLSGIYTIIESGDQQITITEGKLPYFENTWDTYRAYQLDTDRMSMHNAIEYARYNAETDTITGIANTAISAVSSGVMAGAVAGSGMAGAGVGIATQIAGTAVSLYENQRNRELTELQARDNFELSKKKAIQQPQTAYNTAYGQIYCKLNLINPLCVAVSLPNNLDSDYYTAWCNDMGYPAEGVQTATVKNGFYQGKLLSTSNTKTGMYWDECNKVFMTGFKFVTP